jgi:Mg-chelatase subunit ChlD
MALRRYNYELPAWEAVFEPLEDLFSSRGPFLPIGRVLLHDELSLQLRYAGGGDPTGGSGKVLSWSIERWPAEGMTVTYRAEVLECGEFPSAEPGESKVEVEYAEPLFPRTREIFPLPDSRLTVPCAPPTPSPPAPGTPTPRPSPSATATATDTRPTPTESSPTPRPATGTPWPPSLVRRAWLPLLTSGACLTEHAALDLVIVADVSGSMSIADAPGFESRWDLARALVLATIYGGDGATGLRPAIDRVGLVAFGGAAFPLVSLPLEPCCDEGRRSQIETFWKIDGSDFARGLRQAGTLFSNAAPRAASRGLLLVTDGDLGATTPEQLDASLAALDQAGVTRYVVGVGAEVERAVLTRLAGAGRRAHRTADHPASALPRTLAGVVRCLR